MEKTLGQESGQTVWQGDKTVVIITLIVIDVLLALMLVGLVACSGSAFDIAGTWKVTGGPGYGQAQPGAVVQFANGRCNFFSPSDTYAFTKSGSDYQLSVTGLLGDGGTFTVKVKDNDHISIYDGSDLQIEMQRAN